MADSTNRSARILVVDADAGSGQRIADALNDDGYAAEYCGSAARALTRARHAVPSVMIVDERLEGCSGCEFVRQVQAESPHGEIPVIFTSGTHGPDAVEQAHAAGGLYFLSKPIDLSVLRELVDKSLWMPHLVRRHIENQAHAATPKSPRLLHNDASFRSPHS